MKRLLGACLFFLLSLSGYAQAGTLMISSRPTGARIIVNGRTADKKSPVILRDLRPGRYRVQWLRDGYVPQKQTVTVDADEVTAVTPVLEELTFLPKFASDETLLLNGVPISGTRGNWKMPAGTYDIYEDQNILRIESKYPYSSLINVLHGAAPAMWAGTALLGIYDYYHPQSEGHFFSAPVYTAMGVALTLTALDAGLLLQKANYTKQTAKMLKPQDRTSAEALHNAGEKAFGREQFTEALEYFNDILLYHGSSDFFLPALYKSARIHQIRGDTPLAEANLELIVSEYPDPVYFDRSCKTLADLATGQKDLPRAISYLEKMVFVDPLYNPETIRSYIETLRDKE